jgi:hypothetical protein
VAREANAQLLDLPPGWEGGDPQALLVAVSNELHSPQEPTRLAALHWLNTLLARSRKTVRAAPAAGAAGPCHATCSLLDSAEASCHCRYDGSSRI